MAVIARFRCEPCGLVVAEYDPGPYDGPPGVMVRRLAAFLTCYRCAGPVAAVSLKP